jgi:polar amino acid transport system ATP-binding protein
MSALPIIDIMPLRAGDDAGVAAQIGEACRTHGFFYVVGHGVEESLCTALDRLARDFFARPEAEKSAIRMELGGRAWRGWFPLGGELTSGRPDGKEGLYLGVELAAEDPRVLAGTPLHGSNLFPLQPAGLREAALAYIDALTALGHTLMRGIALSLGLASDYFAENGMRDPLALFRIFQYPANPDVRDACWGVGEHTDYGLLTMLRQDDVGGLEVKSPSGWIEAPPVPHSFVCNIGDMLELMTRGLYVSTPHRVVLNTSGRDRISMPFFFDPAFDAPVRPIPGLGGAQRPQDDSATRWDRASVHAFGGTYGDYLLAKIGRVFPQLKKTLGSGLANAHRMRVCKT